MNPAVDALFRDCVVQIGQGTGFFVAPGRIATAAHVLQIGGESPSSAQVIWKEQRVDCIVEMNLEDGTRLFATEPWPDIAILAVPHDVWPDHPCVRLDQSTVPPERGGDFIAYGFPKRRDTVARTPLALGYRGPYGKEGEAYESFSGERVQPGFSGAPILDGERATVAQILVQTLNTQADEGALGVAFSAVPDLAEILASNNTFHQTDRRWADASRRFPRYAIVLAGLIVVVFFAAVAFLVLRDEPTEPFAAAVDGIAVTEIAAAEDGLGDWIASGLSQLEPVDVCDVAGPAIEVWPPARTASSEVFEREDRANADLTVDGSTSVRTFDGLTDLSLRLRFVSLGARAGADPSLIEEIRTTPAVIDLNRDLDTSALNKLPELRTVPTLLMGLRTLDSGEPRKARCFFEAARAEISKTTSRRGDELLASIETLIAVSWLRETGLERDPSYLQNAEEALDKAEALTDFGPGTAAHAQIAINRLGIGFYRTVDPAGGLADGVSLGDAVALQSAYGALMEARGVSGVTRVLASTMQAKIALAAAIAGDDASQLALARTAGTTAVDLGGSVSDPAITPYLADAHWILGQVAVERGELEEAVEHFSSAASLVGGQIKQRYLLSESVVRALIGDCQVAQRIVESVETYIASEGSPGLDHELIGASKVVSERC